MEITEEEWMRLKQGLGQLAPPGVLCKECPKPIWGRIFHPANRLHSSMACGPTEDSAVCRCGCSGYDDRCDLYLAYYEGPIQVPESHSCCQIPGRT